MSGPIAPHRFVVVSVLDVGHSVAVSHCYRVLCFVLFLVFVFINFQESLNSDGGRGWDLYSL